MGNAALWLYLPAGVVLLLMSPTLRKDRRWWAAAAVWGLYLLWVGRLPLVSPSATSPKPPSSPSYGTSTGDRKGSPQAERATSGGTDQASTYYDNGYAYGLEMAAACKRLAQGSPSTAREQAAKWRRELVQTLRDAHPQQTDLVQFTTGKLQGLTEGLSDTSLLP